MKIVLTVIKPEFESPIDSRFGRGAYFLVVEIESGQWETHPNPGVNASGGAGIQAAQFVTSQHAEAALSGGFGPNAFEALKAAGVSMYLYGDCRTAAEAIERFKAGTLERVEAPQRGQGREGRRGLK